LTNTEILDTVRKIPEPGARVMHQLDLAPDESLAARLRRERLPLPVALRFVTGIASELRDLHAAGHAHGAVDLECLRLSRSGVSLGEGRGGRDKASMARDVEGLGKILNWMLAGNPDPQPCVVVVRRRQSLEALRVATLDLARRCLSGRLGMQRVVTEIRLLSVLARQISESPVKISPPVRPAADWKVISVEPAKGPGSTPVVSPSGLKCPRCGCTWAHLSRPRSGLDALLIRFHRPIYRCPVCLYRYAQVLGMRIARPAED
jgi:hypothetical protein